MTALSDAQAALEAARAIAEAATDAEAAALSAAVTFRAQVTAGGTTVTAADLADADAQVKFTNLAALGAQSGIAALQEAVSAERADEVATTIVTTLPGLGADVVAALAALVSALDPVTAAIEAYDRFANDATRQLGTNQAANSPRIRLDRYSAPKVDWMSVASCRGPGQLASAVWPAMAALGAPSDLVRSLRSLAAAAPDLPTI